ncbi:hypothetical protein Acr_00g0028180 [Actinidia rufa]|uniref:Retrotransposon gag domain-containing protein n=1 Tax=Actinidia rufa TaxID=165716 RepID=A0A7J0DEQ4_9ERIC|nr:hypothetical protein Acr_00g0028180 [Actinidia rufa]
MHLRSRCLPRPSTSSPLDNRAHPMANTSQAPNLEGLTVRCTTIIPRTTIVWAEHEEGDIGRQVFPDVKEARLHWNPTKLQEQRARRLEEEDPLAEMIKIGDRICPLPKRSKIWTPASMPSTLEQLGIYEGKIDPIDHLDSYKSLMLLQGCSDEIMCKAFFCHTKGVSEIMIRKLPLGTIDSFGNLSKLFVANFMSCRTIQKNASHLFTVHQKEIEGLKKYVKWFNQAVLEVEYPSDKVGIMAMIDRLRPSQLFDSLSKSVPETLSTLYSKADKYIAAEELVEAKRR